MRAWDTLEERKRVLRMKAAPKPLDVAELERAKERKRRAAQDGAPLSWRKRMQSASGKPVPAPEDASDPAPDAGSKAA